LECTEASFARDVIKEDTELNPFNLPLREIVMHGDDESGNNYFSGIGQFKKGCWERSRNLLMSFIFSSHHFTPEI
jgi:hypothetical protein